MNKICSISNCKNKHVAKSFCQKHYDSYKKYGDPLIVKIKVGENRLNHPLYGCYRSMKKRCLNPNNPDYKNYGGRGIKIAEEWLGIDGFTNYANYLSKLDNYLKPGYSIDCIDNNGDYEPGNIRFATKTQQNLNQRPKYNPLGLPGVFKKKNRFGARIQINNRRVYLGMFSSAEEAHQKYLEALNLRG